MLRRGGVATTGDVVASARAFVTAAPTASSHSGPVEVPPASARSATGPGTCTCAAGRDRSGREPGGDRRARPGASGAATQDAGARGRARAASTRRRTSTWPVSRPTASRARSSRCSRRTAPVASSRAGSRSCSTACSTGSGRSRAKRRCNCSRRADDVQIDRGLRRSRSDAERRQRRRSARALARDGRDRARSQRRRRPAAPDCGERRMIAPERVRGVVDAYVDSYRRNDRAACLALFARRRGLARPGRRAAARRPRGGRRVLGPGACDGRLDRAGSERRDRVCEPGRDGVRDPRERSAGRDADHDDHGRGRGVRRSTTKGSSRSCVRTGTCRAHARALSAIACSRASYESVDGGGATAPTRADPGRLSLGHRFRPQSISDER